VTDRGLGTSGAAVTTRGLKLNSASAVELESKTADIMMAREHADAGDNDGANVFIIR